MVLFSAAVLTVAANAPVKIHASGVDSDACIFRG
jgi:hypothetical protein